MADEHLINEMTYTSPANDGKTITFYIPNEQMDQINFQKETDDQGRKIGGGVPYEAKCEALMKSALNVRRQNLFATPNWTELAKQHYTFMPFQYQIDNVNIMLNRFDGCGVFGDQVGLGKTIQALMTAHVMFLSGVIRNAVIVVPEKNVDQWEKEIENKFPKVFEVTSGKEKDLESMLERINNNNHSLGKENHVYILPDTMLRDKALKAIAGEEKQIELNRDLEKPLKQEDRDLLDKIRLEVLAMCNRDILKGLRYNVKAVLEANGWGNEQTLGLFSSYRWPRELCEVTVEMLETALQKLNDYYGTWTRDSIGDKRIKEMEGYLKIAQGKLKAENEFNSRRIAYTPLFFQGSDRLIDLLIVDEIHKFYNWKTKEKDIMGEARTAVSILANIEKKYCVLISATPIRTRLEDIFDLKLLANKKQMGKNIQEAENYFYQTLCQVDPAQPNKLAYMLKENRERFFGLINNFFTRKRITDVSEDMKGFADRTYQEIGDAQKKFLDSLREKIVTRSKILFAQAGIRDGAEHSLQDFEEWRKNDLIQARHWKANTLERNDVLPILRSAIDTELIISADDPCEDIQKRRVAHSLADWRRRGKKSLLLEVDMSKQAHDEGRDIVERVLGKIRDDCEQNHESPQALRKILEPLYIAEYGELWTMDDQTFLADTRGENLCNDVFESLDGFVSSLSGDAVVYYVKKPEGEATEFADALRKQYDNRDVSYGSNQEVSLEKYNTIAVVNQDYKAGVNLQQHSAFVFYGMIDGRGGYMDPVDVEQWIGRVHRTGQVKDCHIITLIDSKDKDKEFLRQYYALLSDPQGLDLFGDSTPDIAFLQPIIVDQIRDRYTVDEMKKAIPDVFDIKGFADLIYLCYCYDQVNKEATSRVIQIRDMIRELCKIKEFGKNNNSPSVTQ